MFRILLAAALASFMTVPSFSADDDTKKLKVGDKAPVFKLRNHDRKDLSLEQLLKKKKFVAVVFYRSASW